MTIQQLVTESTGITDVGLMLNPLRPKRSFSDYYRFNTDSETFIKYKFLAYSKVGTFTEIEGVIGYDSDTDSVPYVKAKQVQDWQLPSDTKYIIQLTDNYEKNPVEIRQVTALIYPV